MIEIASHEFTRTNEYLIPMFCLKKQQCLTNVVIVDKSHLPHSAVEDQTVGHVQQCHHVQTLQQITMAISIHALPWQPKQNRMIKELQCRLDIREYSLHLLEPLCAYWHRNKTSPLISQMTIYDSNKLSADCINVSMFKYRSKRYLNDTGPKNFLFLISQWLVHILSGNGNLVKSC